ncbi:MAG: hypothetical protein IKR09_07420 [Alphaproteobacteria bacterium]|nr:hypothetical protein [Alphaproteobacteria bacterium]
MYKGYQNGKLKFIWNEKEKQPSLINLEKVEIDNEHTINDYVQYHKEFILKTDYPVPVENENIRQKRQEHFVLETDPLKFDMDELRVRYEQEADEQKKTELLKKIGLLREEWLIKKDRIREEFPFIENKP